MTNKQLNVFIGGTHAGVLAQDNIGSLSFQYLRDYRGTPLSSAMPLSTKTYHNKIVAPYLWGLLPEDLAVRRNVAAEANVSPNNPFALLEIIGLDCPGAVQFCQQESISFRKEQLIPMSESDIALRLAQGRAGERGWIAENEHWSLGGQQNKFALRWKNGHWFSCEGAAATTHIFKSDINGLSHQALNEFVCMRLANELGIPAAQVAYHEFEGEPAIVVTRYDRRPENGIVVRLHQEDICQALGCLPANKYTADGGPSSSDILKFLLSDESTAQVNAVEFLQMLLFNYLIAATDAHAKNYSVLLGANGEKRLAPMYDVASIIPYVDQTTWKMKPPKLAMSIGGENRVGHVSMNNLRTMIDQCDLEKVGITAEGCANLLRTYADAIPEKIEQIFDELENTESGMAAKELRVRMEDSIVQLCSNTPLA